MDPLKALLDAGLLARPAFPANSRYHDTPTAVATRADGTPVAHLRRAFRPPPETMATLTTHVVVEGQRLDHVAAQHLGDPTQFWRLCDAGGVMRPRAMTATTGARIRVGGPPGAPGPEET